MKSTHFTRDEVVALRSAIESAIDADLADNKIEQNALEKFLDCTSNPDFDMELQLTLSDGDDFNESRRLHRKRVRESYQPEKDSRSFDEKYKGKSILSEDDDDLVPDFVKKMFN